MGEGEGRASIEALRDVKLSKHRKAMLLSYLRLISERLGVEEVYVFGSRVYGEPLRESDLDMLVVSRQFEGLGFIRSMEELSKLWGGDFTIEVFPYTPQQVEEYRDKKVVVAEALKRGIKIELKPKGS